MTEILPHRHRVANIPWFGKAASIVPERGPISSVACFVGYTKQNNTHRTVTSSKDWLWIKLNFSSLYFFIKALGDMNKAQ